MENISFNVFWICFETVRNNNVLERNLKLLKQMFYAFIETFCRKWEGEILPKLFFTFKQLEKCKNEYYPESLLNHVAKRADAPTCCACQRGLRANGPAWNVPKARRLLMFTCQRAIRHANVLTWRANFSTWLSNVPKGVPIFQAFLLTKC